jgi:tRNA-2-methylthio-N6-dimethylallyladenosine synthase
MRRKYTISEYERRIADLFQACPDLALTSDVICGFPGETDAEHAQNLAFLSRTPYDNLFSFLYSPRPHTGALLKLEEWGEVPRPVALKRLEEVQALQMARTLSRRRARVGGEVEVLVESAAGQRFGRSKENWTVHFDGGAAVGDLVRVRVSSASLVALRGTQLEVTDRAPGTGRSAPGLRLAVVNA